MATAAKTRPAAGGSTSKKAATASAATPAPTTGGGWRSLFAPTPAQNGARPQSPGMGRFFIGMMIYLFVSFVLQILLPLLDVKAFHGKLSTTVLFKLPILGSITITALIFMVTLVGVLWALYKFKILPSSADMRAQGQAMAAQNAAKKGATASAAKSGTSAKSAGNGKSAVTTKNAAGKTTATAKPTSTGKLAAAGTNAKGAKVIEAGESDDLYAQVRAQRLAAARKARKH